MKTLKIVLILFGFLLSSSEAYMQECYIFPIPSSHLGGQTANATALEWASTGTNVFPIGEVILPGNFIDVTETEFNIHPDMEPCGGEINKLIGKYKNSKYPVVLYFPPGAYLIETTILLKYNHIVLKGAGGAGDLLLQTHFHFDFSEDYAHNCISVSGDYNGLEDIYLIDDTQTSIKITYVPSIIVNGVLTYGVTGATDMETTVVGECSGNGIISGNNGVFTCTANLNFGQSYTVYTTFSNNIESMCKLHTVICTSAEDTLNIVQSELSLETTINKGADGIECDFPEGYIQNTISISGCWNWIRGVESDMTRKSHIYISGSLGNSADHNTVTGSYFHHAVDYSDNGGRGYGVAIGGYSRLNRVEDNIFKKLRHAMLLQGDAEKNVIGYNYSRDVEAYNNGLPYAADDLCLHGRTSTNNGPTTNLLEGNHVERSRVDDTHDFNGPYNTFFRNCAGDDYFKVYAPSLFYPGWKQSQYSQNVIGCNMKPIGKTLKRLDKNNWGYYKHYCDGTCYEGLSNNYCSLYWTTKPDFFPDWMDWPFIPYVWHENPAWYRWGSSSVSNTILQGWDDYLNLCGPPKYKFNNVNWENKEEDYLAMKSIELSEVNILQNNNLYFHAENNVILKPGTKIINNNNHVIIKAGNVCGGKSGQWSKYSIYDKAGKIKLSSTTIQIDTVEKSNEIGFTGNEINRQADLMIFPNPNRGEFFIKNDCNISKEDISIFGILSNKLKFDLNIGNEFITVTLKENYNGIIFIRLKRSDSYKLFKLVVE